MVTTLWLLQNPTYLAHINNITYFTRPTLWFFLERTSISLQVEHRHRLVSFGFHISITHTPAASKSPPACCILLPRIVEIGIFLRKWRDNMYVRSSCGGVQVLHWSTWLELYVHKIEMLYIHSDNTSRIVPAFCKSPCDHQHAEFNTSCSIPWLYSQGPLERTYNCLIMLWVIVIKILSLLRVGVILWFFQCGWRILMWATLRAGSYRSQVLSHLRSWCNLSHWEHGGWDLPLHMGPQVLSPKFDMNAYMVTLFGGEAWDVCWAKN